MTLAVKQERRPGTEVWRLRAKVLDRLAAAGGLGVESDATERTVSTAVERCEAMAERLIASGSYSDGEAWNQAIRVEILGTEGD